MDLIERLRPKWRHSDPEVRAAAVREMGDEDRERLAALAENDPDARVRRAAVRRLDDPALLERLATGDPEPALRELADERLREVLVAIASSDAPGDACDAALARLTDARTLAAVAIGAAHERIRRQALARTSGERVLREVVRSAADPAIRAAALARIEDPGILRSIAAGDGPVEIGVAAVERIDDVAALQAIAGAHAAPKSVRQRARARLASLAGDRPVIGVKEARARQLELCNLVHALRATADVRAASDRVCEAQNEWNALARAVEPRADVAEPFAAACRAILEDAAGLARRLAVADQVRMALEENVAARAALCERVEALDGADAGRELAAARAAWGSLPALPDEEGAALARRFAAACDACVARHRSRLARQTLRERIAGLVEEAETLAGTSPPPKAKRWRELERRWAARERPEDEEIEGLERRFVAAGERLQQRWREIERERAGRDLENLRRLQELHARLTELATAESLRPAVGRRELQAAEAALRDLGPLPSSERRAAWTERLTEAHDELVRRVAREEQTEEWRRWANVGAQEEIIARVEALLEANDLVEGTRQLGRLQDEWAKVATASPEKSQALWERFRTARNELRRRCDAYLGANLEKKRALCAQVAGVGESTAWNETAELVRRLQAEWNSIGPVPGKHVKALWQEFREPCDRFFARRKEHFGRLDEERRGNADRKTKLCEQAEALADSTDWETTAAAVKRLQAEWKASGPPPRDQAEALWQRFRTACDRFFDRRGRRAEIAREEALRAARTLCERLETIAVALAGGAGEPAEAGSAADEVGRRVDEVWGEWARLELPAGDDVVALADRVRAACEGIATARPESLRGTRLDPAATAKRREKLCARLEALLPPTEEQPRQRSLQEMAMALRDRLASNTIAGKDAGRRQDVEREVERIGASWASLGPVLDETGRRLVERFERARARARDALK